MNHTIKKQGLPKGLAVCCFVDNDMITTEFSQTFFGPPNIEVEEY